MLSAGSAFTASALQQAAGNWQEPHGCVQCDQLHVLSAIGVIGVFGVFGVFGVISVITSSAAAGLGLAGASDRHRHS